MAKSGYSLRNYRSLADKDLKSFRVVVKETDILVRVDAASYVESLKEETEKVIFQGRNILEEYVKEDPEFRTSLNPYLVPPGAPLIARRLALASNIAGVGPMASVAGVFSELTGNFLLGKCEEVIVENGGDIFMSSSKTRQVAVFAGESTFSGRLALEIPPYGRPLGICTSSGIVGPSFSQGRADAAVIIAENTPLGDAVATATANLVKEKEDVEKAVEFAYAINGVWGVLVIKEDVLGARGMIRLVPI